jgi:hypothetical protein
MRADPRYKPLPDEPLALLEEGRVHDAVRALRRSHNLDLRQAQNWIDWHIDENPMLRIQLETQRRAARRRFFLWFLFVDAAVTAAIVYYLLYVRV